MKRSDRNRGADQPCNKGVSARQSNQTSINDATTSKIRGEGARAHGTAKAPHGTQEWASSNLNIQNGCEHDCKYCYAKAMAIRFKRSTAQGWPKPQLCHDKIEQSYGKRNGTVMFPSAHDITDSNIEEYLKVAKKILGA